MKKNTSKARTKSQPTLYTLEVFLASGPITEEFVQKNPQVSRVIEICGDQTFEDLHDAIFEAFDREEEHLYEFQVGGKGPQDPKAKRYVCDAEGDDAAGIASQTRLDAVGLKPQTAFGYWFDYGDDWWHQINVVAISEEVPKGKYPKITKRVGASPPQYPDWDEDK